MELSESQVRSLQVLLDKQAIRDVLARYARGLDRVWPELADSVFHEESWDYHGSFSGSGHDFIYNAPRSPVWLSHANVVTHHMMATSTIEVSGDSADSETYFIASGIRVADGVRRVYQMCGRYLDRLDREGGEWRIRVRRAVIDLSYEFDEGDPWVDQPNYPLGQRYPDDAVFHPESMVFPE